MEEERRAALLHNLAAVRRGIAEAAERAGRDPDGVRLVAVTKGQELDDLRAVLAGGVTDLGENRVQELVAKAAALVGEKPAPRWHMIGYLQRNKVKALLPWCRIIHSVDRLSLGEEIARRAEGGPPVEVLVEVNVTGEATKAGVRPAEAEGLLRALAALPGIRVRGLMTVAPVSPEAERNRPVFRELRRLSERLNGLGIPGVELVELSMGMSQDYAVAVEEGATLVRVGTAIFGPRAAIIREVH
ncbi:MAG: YggS family pyridoxal phosphate-dependent enzyme [Bacillota bacterium]|nr:YggS family pyridoxal phosphate-dependent enzyme [Bacillota bacterium]